MEVDPSVFPSQADHGTLLITFVFLLGLGAVLVGWGLARRAADRHLRGHAQARLVRVDRSATARIGRPVVYLFPTDQGATVELPSVGLHLHPHRSGSTVPVRYDPDRPTHAHADEPASLVLPWATAVAAGCALVLAALAVVLPQL